MSEEITKAIIDGDYSIMVALIGFIGSVIVAVISAIVSFIVAKKTTKDEVRKVQSKFVEKLYEKRIELYPELWKISDRIYGPRKKYKTVEETVRRNQKECLTELRSWKRNSGGFMFFSNKSVKAFGELEERLLKYPERKDGYSDDQIRNLENARIIFCKALKEDMGIFDIAEEEIKKIAK